MSVGVGERVLVWVSVRDCVSVCVFLPQLPACKADLSHVILYRHLRPVWPYQTFPRHTVPPTSACLAIPNFPTPYCTATFGLSGHTKLSHAVLYRHLRPVWPYQTFPHYLTNGTIFGKKLCKNVCFGSLYSFCVNRLSL